jgi:hypothetical protein
MKIGDLMDQYQNGERKAVEGPLDFLQALALVQMYRRLIDTLQEMDNANLFELRDKILPDAKKLSMHYTVCKLLVEAEEIL